MLQVDEQIFYQYLDYFSISLDSVDLDQPNRLLAEQFMEKQLQLIDVLPFLREKSREGVSHYGRIDTHLNQIGHKAVAEAIRQIVSHI